MEVNIEDDSLVSLEKRGLGGELANIIDLSNPEGTSSGSFPAAGSKAGVDLDKVGVPSIAGGLEVVNAALLLGAGTENVTELGSANKARHVF